jgi:hypothetical protein
MALRRLERKERLRTGHGSAYSFALEFGIDLDVT